MVSLPVLDPSMIMGTVMVVLVLLFLRFGNAVVEYFFSFRTSPVDAVEDTIAE